MGSWNNLYVLFSAWHSVSFNVSKGFHEMTGRGELWHSGRYYTGGKTQPSVLLVFSVVEGQNNERKTVNFLRKVFQSEPGLAHQRNPQNETLLYFTCKQGKSTVIRYLLELCDPAETCPRGSAIHACVHAMHSGNLSSTSGCDIIDELLERGCAIDVQDSNAMTALYLASTLGCYSAVKLLVDRGCDVTIACDEEMTALHTAAINGKLGVVHYLLGEFFFIWACSHWSV